MIRTKEISLLFSLMTILTASSPAGGEPNDASVPLTFQISPVELPAPQFVRIYHSPLPAWRGTVTYAAGVALNDSPYFPSVAGPSMVDNFVQFAQGQGISEQQRRFLGRTHAGLERRPYYTPPEDPNASQLLLYAVSPDDARKMADLYLHFARDRFRDDVKPLQAELKKLTEKLADEQQKLPEAKQATEAAKKAFEDLQKQVPYRDDKQALDAAAELDKMLNMAQVDIAGIRAKIEAIQSYQKPHRGDAILSPRLELMFVEEAVALQGAEGRKRMATTLRKQADSYIDLKAAWERAEAEQERLAHDVLVGPDTIIGVQNRLANTMRQEPKIPNNRVFIYTVRPENPPTPRPRTQPKPQAAEP
jgi:hypothetical protein